MICYCTMNNRGDIYNKGQINLLTGDGVVLRERERERKRKRKEREREKRKKERNRGGGGGGGE